MADDYIRINTEKSTFSDTCPMAPSHELFPAISRNAAGKDHIENHS